MKDEYCMTGFEFDNLLDSLPKDPTDNQQVNRSAKAEHMTSPPLLSATKKLQSTGFISHSFKFTWKAELGDWLCDKMIKIKSV
jgi:hypothetical protein